MKLRSVWKAALLIVLSVCLVLALFFVGLIAFILRVSQADNAWNISMTRVSEGLGTAEEGYPFTESGYLREEGLWAILIDGESGDVVWQLDKPATVPDHYTLTDVASFTRWYLDDYPVLTRIRDDGLLVVGCPRESTWKYTVYMDAETIHLAPYWTAGMLLLSLGCVLALAALFLRRWFRTEQQRRDAARSAWVNGVSHDIRTPLSMVMGYAGQLEDDETLPRLRREQAAVIRRQSQTIRDLVNDLNLTMRLDYDMQPLRKSLVSPAAILRQGAADLLNSGLGDAYSVEMVIPDCPPALEGDAFLLRRAVNNLFQNCVRHNPEGCAIRAGLRQEGKWCVLWVESCRIDSAPCAAHPAEEADGGASHGTGLKLVQQIARSHGGTARFRSGDGHFLSQLFLPLSRR